MTKEKKRNWGNFTECERYDQSFLKLCSRFHLGHILEVGLLACLLGFKIVELQFLLECNRDSFDFL